jgi:hypothetical protein
MALQSEEDLRDEVFALFHAREGNRIKPLAYRRVVIACLKELS